MTDQTIRGEQSHGGAAMTAADWISARRDLLNEATGPEWEVYEYDSTSLRQKTVAVRTVKRSGGNTPVCSTGYAAWPESRPDAALIADARTSLPLALKALEAVLELHRENTPEDGGCLGYTDAGYVDLDSWCVGCSEQSEREYGINWPCATFTAVTTALGIEVQPT